MKVRNDRNRTYLFELYYTERHLIGDTTFREDLFVHFLEAMSEYRKFKYAERIDENIFAGSMSGKNVLIIIYNKGNVKAALQDLKTNLTKAAKKVASRYSIYRTYCLHVKPAGDSELILLSKLMLN